MRTISAARFMYRFLAGRPLDGTRRTDATFLRPGWTSLQHKSYLTRVDYWAGWQRSFTRLSVLTLTVVAPVEVLTRPAVVHQWLNTAMHVGTLVACFILVRRVRRWRLTRHVIRPLAEAASPHVKYGHDLPLRRWLRVPRHLVMVPDLPPVAWIRRHASERVDTINAYMTDHEKQRWVWTRILNTIHGWNIVREKITAPFTAQKRARTSVKMRIPHSLGNVPKDTRTALCNTAVSKLGGTWEADWQLRGARAVLVLRPRPEPPARVIYAQFYERMIAAKATELALGFSAGYRTACVDINSDSPHIMLSMGSGCGKSVLLRLIAAQAIAKGWAFILLDPKQDHYWCADLIAQGVPGIYYFRKIPQIHDALLKLNQVREWRSDIDFDVRGTQPMQRAVVGFEEMNMGVNGLRSYWTGNGGKGKSPALTALGDLANAGRSASLNLIAIGQYLTAPVFGGPEARESFGSRVLGWYTTNAWRTLVPEYGPPPARSSVRGRVQLCQGGGSPLETQVAYLTHEQIREYIGKSDLAGVVPGDTIPFGWELPSSVPALNQTASQAPIEPPAIPEGTMRDLAGWCDTGIVPWEYNTARKRRYREQREERCTLPADRNVYTETEIHAWIEGAKIPL